MAAHTRQQSAQLEQYEYKIIAYPLDATVVTPKLFYSSCNLVNCQSWTYEESEAVIYKNYMQAFRELMHIKRKNSIFLILIDPEKHD